MGFYRYLKETLLCKNNTYMLCYDRGFLVIRESTGKKFVQKLRIHPFLKSVSFVERLLRYEPRAAISLQEDEFLFTDHGFIYRYSVKNNSISVEHRFEKGMNNPLTFCSRYDDMGNLIDLLYGEYIWNGEKGPVSIYRRFQGKWDEVYSFPSNMVTHIHNIVYDRYRKRYLIMTGDEDQESAIWQAEIDFSQVKPIVIGQQRYRACVAYPVPDGVYYATDTPLEQNWLYRLREENERAFVEKICPMPGPCIFGKTANESLYMATSVEGDPTKGKWGYRFSNKLGRGVQDRYVHIIRCSSHGTVREIGKMKKDIMPMWLFQFGNAKFPETSDHCIYVCPQSTTCRRGTYILNSKEIL